MRHSSVFLFSLLISPPVVLLFFLERPFLFPALRDKALTTPADFFLGETPSSLLTPLGSFGGNYSLFFLASVLSYVVQKNPSADSGSSWLDGNLPFSSFPPLYHHLPAAIDRFDSFFLSSSGPAHFQECLSPFFCCLCLFRRPFPFFGGRWGDLS